MALRAHRPVTDFIKNKSARGNGFGLQWRHGWITSVIQGWHMRYDSEHKERDWAEGPHRVGVAGMMAKVGLTHVSVAEIREAANKALVRIEVTYDVPPAVQLTAPLRDCTRTLRTISRRTSRA